MNLKLLSSLNKRLKNVALNQENYPIFRSHSCRMNACDLIFREGLKSHKQSLG